MAEQFSRIDLKQLSNPGTTLATADQRAGVVDN